MKTAFPSVLKISICETASICQERRGEEEERKKGNWVVMY